MKVSFEEVGQWGATFTCDAVQEGKLVKPSGNGAVALCAEGEDFCGVVSAVARDGAACTVQLGGFVTVPYSGTAPEVGWAGLTADQAGGVKGKAGGRSYLVVCVDDGAGTVTFAL